MGEERSEGGGGAHLLIHKGDTNLSPQNLEEERSELSSIAQRERSCWLSASLFSLSGGLLAGVKSKDPVHSIMFSLLFLSTVMALSTLFRAVIY